MKKLKQSLALLGLASIMLVFAFSPVLAAPSDSTEFFPSYHIAQGESKIISLEAQNNDTIEHHFTLKTEGASNDYELYFSTDDLPTTTLSIPAGGNVPLNLNIKLRGNPIVNDDILFVKVLRDDGQEMTTKIAVHINKDFQLDVTSLSDKVEVINGKAVELTFSVKNSGVKEMKAIKLKTELPAKWYVSQGADTSIDLKPGETGTIKITVEVPSSQIAGSASVKVAAISAETQGSQVNLPVMVKTGANIAYWMTGLLLLIAVITVIQFRKYGRR